MTVVAVTPRPTTGLVRGLSVTAKAGLVLLLLSALLHPDLGNMRDKAAWTRAVAYPLLGFTIPTLWFAFWRDRAPFPWAADLMVTLTRFSDILGNRLDLYDTVVWFDDWMHFANTDLLAAAVILLTLPCPPCPAQPAVRPASSEPSPSASPPPSDGRLRSTSPSSAAPPSSPRHRPTPSETSEWAPRLLCWPR